MKLNDMTMRVYSRQVDTADAGLQPVRKQILWFIDEASAVTWKWSSEGFWLHSNQIYAVSCGDSEDEQAPVIEIVMSGGPYIHCDPEKHPTSLFIITSSSFVGLFPEHYSR